MVHASDHAAPPMGNVVCRLPLDEQALARGYVIAAAPELLGALEAIVRDSDKLPEAQFQLAVAAIAKARGEP